MIRGFILSQDSSEFNSYRIYNYKRTQHVNVPLAFIKEHNLFKYSKYSTYSNNYIHIETIPMPKLLELKIKLM